MVLSSFAWCKYSYRRHVICSATLHTFHSSETSKSICHIPKTKNLILDITRKQLLQSNFQMVKYSLLHEGNMITMSWLASIIVFTAFSRKKLYQFIIRWHINGHIIDKKNDSVCMLLQFISCNGLRYQKWFSMHITYCSVSKMSTFLLKLLKRKFQFRKYFIIQISLLQAFRTWVVFHRHSFLYRSRDTSSHKLI